jgi:hypothetical protein
MKFVYPLIGVPLLAEIFLFWDLDETLRFPFLLIAVMLIWAARYAYKECLEFKKVSIDDQNLYVSNYLKEIVIPISQIEKVTENNWFKFQKIEIQLKSATEFGDKILFMPTTETLLVFMTHPIVKELNHLAAERQKVLIK